MKMIYAILLVCVLLITRYVLLFQRKKLKADCNNNIMPRFGGWRGRFMFIFTAFLVVAMENAARSHHMQIKHLIMLISLYCILISVWVAWCWCSSISIQVENGTAFVMY